MSEQWLERLFPTSGGSVEERAALAAEHATAFYVRCYDLRDVPEEQDLGDVVVITVDAGAILTSYAAAFGGEHDGIAFWTTAQFPPGELDHCRPGDPGMAVISREQYLKAAADGWPNL